MSESWRVWKKKDEKNCNNEFSITWSSFRVSELRGFIFLLFAASHFILQRDQQSIQLKKVKIQLKEKTKTWKVFDFFRIRSKFDAKHFMSRWTHKVSKWSMREDFVKKNIWIISANTAAAAVIDHGETTSETKVVWGRWEHKLFPIRQKIKKNFEKLKLKFVHEGHGAAATSTAWENIFLIFPYTDELFNFVCTLKVI